MIKEQYDIVVIGGGPAGIAAANASATGTASVLLIDATETLGGNYYKSPPSELEPALTAQDRKRLAGLRDKVDALSRQGVDVLSNTHVWGIFQGAEATYSGPVADAAQPFTLYLEPGDKVEARSLIIAAGVHDRAIPFPGWTMPGVMTPGAVQLLIKKQGLLPGKRVVVAGSGPLQLAVAATLADAGAQVVAMLDPSGALEGMAGMPGAMWGQWGKIQEFSGYMASLVRHRVPTHFRHTILRAEGTLQDGVRRAVIGRVDGQGYPIPGTERALEVDLICVAYGFMPSIALTLHLGCAHDYAPNLAAYIPRHDEQMQTNLNGVFVAGDMTGVGGKALAELQGKVAGISALETLGLLAPGEAEARRSDLRPAIVREERFARWLWGRWRTKPGFFGIMEAGTLVCRCEGVTAGEIKQSCANGAKNLAGAKLRTRLGMGVCQGRYCTVNAAVIMAQELDCAVPEIGLPTVRPPLIPIRLKNVALRDDS